MKTTFYPLLLTAALCFGLLSCVRSSDDGRTGYVKVGDQIPTFTVYDDDGNAFSSSEFTGKRSLLFLFDVTCEQCRKKFEEIQTVWDTLKDSTGNYRIVAISRGSGGKTRVEDIVNVNKYWSDNNLTFPKYFDEDRKVYGLFAEMWVPRIYIINKQGIVKWLSVEEINTANELLDKINSL